jgi:histidinol-phosphate aminotransferase
MSTFDLSALLCPELAGLHSYLPDLRKYAIRLDANEAPPLLGADVRAQLAQAAAEMTWERYPDPTYSALRQAIAARIGMPMEEILVGAGSDEIIALLTTALSRPLSAGPVTVLTTSPTFVMYWQHAVARGQRVVEVPLDEDWDLASAALDAAIAATSPNLIFIASPNNPTGNLMSLDRLEHLIERAGQALVVIDEAYIDYSSRDQLQLYRRYSNVAIMRTLSKIGFAALRVGYLLARPELAAALDKVRSPYNLPTVSQRLATLVLTQHAVAIAAMVRTVKAERERMAGELRALGMRVGPSEANFLWISTPLPAAEAQSQLGQRGILVRSFHPKGGRLAQQLRVTVGTPEENDRFLAAMREIVGGLAR